MTPFEEFFQANYSQDVDPLWKMKLAACWNAALDAAKATKIVERQHCPQCGLEHHRLLIEVSQVEALKNS